MGILPQEREQVWAQHVRLVCVGSVNTKFLKRDNHYDGQLILNCALSGLAQMSDSLEMLFALSQLYGFWH